MMKIVVQLDYHGPKGKKKALAAVSRMSGLTSIAIDDDTRKLTVLGDVDPVAVVVNLRKVCNALVITVGKPEEKKEDKKKEEKKEEKKEDKKEEKKDGKKEEKKDESKKDEKKKNEEKMNQYVRDMVESYRNYNPHLTNYYGVHSAEENPNACAIC